MAISMAHFKVGQVGDSVIAVQIRLVSFKAGQTDLKLLAIFKM